MLEKRYVAGKWIYRVPGALVWSYSRADAGCLRRARPGTLAAMVMVPSGPDGRGTGEFIENSTLPAVQQLRSVSR